MKYLLIEVKSKDEAKKIINNHYGFVMWTADPKTGKEFPFPYENITYWEEDDDIKEQ